MLKNKIIQMKFVDDPCTTREPAPENPLSCFAAADIARAKSEQMAKTAALGFVLYKATDTICKIAIHTASVKIK